MVRNDKHIKQKIERLNENEARWIESQLAEAAKFVAAFSPADAGRPVTLAALDRAWAAWIASKPSGTEINAIVNFVGIAFGQALMEGAGLKWVIATDEHGTELAVYGLPGKGDVLVYPANFVAKRWERREVNFLEESYKRIAADVRRIASEPEGGR